MRQRIPTLSDLAAAANVSAMTASRALKNQPGVSPGTRTAILKVAQELGYVPNRVAQKLSGGHSAVIGVLAPRLDHPFVSSAVNSVVQAAADAAHEVLVYSHTAQGKFQPSNVLHLLQQFTDGVVALLPYQFDFVQLIARERFPLVMIDSPLEPTELPSVSSDSYTGARAAMQHLAELGHQRVAFIAGSPQLASAQERLRAYTEAITLHGLARDPALIVQGRYQVEGGRAAALKLLELKTRPTAIFAANDLSAFGAMSVLQESGLRIPQDISVVGFDDLPLASLMTPGLTTVRQPLQQLGHAAVSLLLARIAGIAATNARVTLPTELVVRNSTAAPPL